MFCLLHGAGDVARFKSVHLERSLVMLANAQIPTTGAGNGAPGVSAAFTGPGDTANAGAALVYLTANQAFSAATRGQAIMNVCNSTGGVTDLGCANIVTDAVTGIAVPQTIAGLPCPDAGGNCTIQQFIDTSGANNCGASQNVACNPFQNTIADRASWMPNQVGGKACAVGAGAAGLQYSTPNSFGQVSSFNQPYSVLAVAERTGATSTQRRVLYGGNNAADLEFATAGNMLFYAGGAAPTASAADNAPHAVAAFFSGASSTLSVDSYSASTLNPGTTALGNTVITMLGTGTVGLTGIFCGAGIWGSLTSTQQTNYLANARAFYGF